MMFFVAFAAGVLCEFCFWQWLERRRRPATDDWARYCRDFHQWCEWRRALYEANRRTRRLMDGLRAGGGQN